MLHKIVITPEEGWFGQPKYSTYTKTILRCAGFCLYFLHSIREAGEIIIDPTYTSRIIVTVACLNVLSYSV